MLGSCKPQARGNSSSHKIASQNFSDELSRFVQSDLIVGDFCPFAAPLRPQFLFDVKKLRHQNISEDNFKQKVIIYNNFIKYVFTSSEMGGGDYICVI